MTSMVDSARSALDRANTLVTPAMRAAVDRLDPTMRLIASYQFGWVDQDGRATTGSTGKGLRPAFAVLSAMAAGGKAEDGVPGAVAVDLIHNFSLLHDDVMDRDVERRHRPTGWVAFGEGQAILAGSAMCMLAVDVLAELPGAATRALPCLSTAVQQLISGQSDDLAFENTPTIDLEACVRMEAGKTASLMACATAIGALLVDAPQSVVDALYTYGFELGVAFQLVDDILGITGDPAVTGKSASSDVRSGKRSAPVVAALCSGTAAGEELRTHLAGGPPTTEVDVERAVELIRAAGGLDWAATEADARLTRALEHLHSLPVHNSAVAELETLARYVVDRDR